MCQNRFPLRSRSGVSEERHAHKAAGNQTGIPRVKQACLNGDTEPFDAGREPVIEYGLKSEDGGYIHEAYQDSEYP